MNKWEITWTNLERESNFERKRDYFSEERRVNEERRWRRLCKNKGRKTIIKKDDP